MLWVPISILLMLARAATFKMTFLHADWDGSCSPDELHTKRMSRGKADPGPDVPWRRPTGAQQSADVARQGSSDATQAAVPRS